ncbi:hypothetical protein L7F22_052149 [Adiantum nelumboides]|nr:hypothetical protein [Adiantum nelumboides]
MCIYVKVFPTKLPSRCGVDGESDCDGPWTKRGCYSQDTKRVLRKRRESVRESGDNESEEAFLEVMLLALRRDGNQKAHQASSRKAAGLAPFIAMDAGYLRDTLGQVVAKGCAETIAVAPVDPMHYFSLWLLKHVENAKLVDDLQKERELLSHLQVAKQDKQRQADSREQEKIHKQDTTVNFLKSIQTDPYLLFDECLKAILEFTEGITSPPQLTHPANPFNSADPASSTSVPRIEWEEEDVLRYIPLPNQPQVPPIQQIPSSPVPIGTPLPPNAPPWSLGRKTKTHLFPNIPHTLPAEPTAASSNPPHIQPSNSTPTSSSTPTNPYVPENPIHQPSLLGPSPTSRPSKSSKVRSLKEIYQNSHHSLFMDPSPSSTPIISDCLHEASFLDVAAADALYCQVLQAFSDDDFDSLLLVVETIDEISLDEALSGPEASSWHQAMDSEYQSLMANGTWQLVPAPPNRKLVTCKWLLRKKFHADGSVSRYKARLVARGFTQIPGMDYSETFSPVLRITSFRVLIAIAALFGFLLHQMDVRTAFLNGDLQEEIYMSQPDGGYTSLQHPDYVCRLLKALYGLKQSPRQWYLRFHQCMISLGYTRFQSDANVYSRHSTNVLLFLAIYVDDILILSNSQYAIDKAKGELQASFSMIDMGTLHYCLGIQVLQDPSKGLIRISQQTYIQSLLTKFNMSSCKGVETPLPTSLKLKQPDSTLTASIETQSFPFANILGGIRYLVTCTRPDICFATNLLSRYMKAPSLQHIQHLK